MNPEHLHLLLNHFPTVGFSVGIGLLLVAIFAGKDELKRASLAIIFLMAAMTILTYVSGNDAQQAMLEQPDLPVALIDAHESAALAASALMQLTGFFAWFALWAWRRVARIPGWTMTAVLILSIATFVLMARAAYMGGQIHHTEIHPVVTDSASGAEPEPTMARALGTAIEARVWVWPALETLHFVGLCMLFGVVLTLDLRMLGMGKTLSFAALYQLLPIGMLGFALNLITGALFFVATPRQYTGFLFFFKMILVVVGAVNILYFMLFDAPWKVDEGSDAPATAKVVAVSAIVIWIAVLFCGHMLPFLGNSF